MKRRYDIIYADPPWSYGQGYDRGSPGYRTMKVQDIATLPVSGLAKDDSMCFLWATWPNLHHALTVMRIWGFAYKTIGFIWVKLNGLHEVFLGTGNYTRANSEPCLLGVRGKVPFVRPERAVSSVVISPRGEHSAKPPVVRDRIERLCGDDIVKLDKIELFSRELVDGWEGWGDEHPDPINWVEIIRPKGQARLV